MRISLEQIGGTESTLIGANDTVADVISRATNGGDAANYAATVNDQPASPDQRLREGDTLSIVPKQVKGA